MLHIQDHCFQYSGQDFSVMLMAIVFDRLSFVIELLDRL